jgi:hypothetical protein
MDIVKDGYRSPINHNMQSYICVATKDNEIIFAPPPFDRPRIFPNTKLALAFVEREGLTETKLFRMAYVKSEAGLTFKIVEEITN